MFIKYLKNLILISICSQIAWAENKTDADKQKTLDKIIVESKKQYLDSHRHDTTEKVEVLSKERIEKSNSTSLNEAIDRMPGIDSQDYCVNCGAKRISINGLRGDHTSVLIDGIPLFSAISSVYGFDAIPMLSVEEIEVRRGTGSSLINPEAIGGTINIITLMPKESGSKASLSYGTYNSQIADFIHNYVSDNYKLSLGAEYNQQQEWDTDNNNFAESPWKQRYSLFAKQTINLTDKIQWATRLSYVNMEIVGGNTRQYKLRGPITSQASDTDFVDGDVRKDFIGDIKGISEYIGVDRTEGTSKLIAILDSKNTLEFNLAGAIYNQTSYYMHAFDYITQNITGYADLKWRRQLNDEQTLMLGASQRLETLRSESEVMYDTNNIPKDNFNYKAYSIFAQHEWFLPHNLELSSALRYEHLRNSWTFLGDLDENILSPRFMLKWEPDEHFSQQLAYGYGYRMPLTSIESAHGAYDGFVVDIDKLEKSHSLVYSLSYNTPTYYVTPSIHYTHLQNMAYPLEPEIAHSGPLTFVNDNQSHDIFVYDILMGYKPTEPWLIELGYETYRYPDAYKAKLPTAAIEQRLNIRTEYQIKNGFGFVLNGSWIGSRNIGKYYQYEDHYNVSDGLFGASEQKFQISPNYWQWDLSVTKKVNKIDYMLSVQNIFNYTQTKAGDSPAMWHSHDGHTHLDNRHVWGPNRGREINLKMTYNF